MKRGTRTDAIVFRLTQDIVAKRLPPGAALDEAEIGREFGVSRTPVREALRQLAAGGFVELRAHRAPLVRRVDGDRLTEMFFVMAELEALCAMQASRAMGPAERRALELHHASMGEAMRAGDVAAYRAGNVVFHTMIYEGARNAYLMELALNLRERLAAHRGIQLQAPARLAKSHAEHGEILMAIQRGDPERAGQAMRMHLALTQEAFDAMNRMDEGLPAS